VDSRRCYIGVYVGGFLAERETPYKYEKLHKRSYLGLKTLRVYNR